MATIEAAVYAKLVAVPVSCKTVRQIADSIAEDGAIFVGMSPRKRHGAVLRALRNLKCMGHAQEMNDSFPVLWMKL